MSSGRPPFTRSSPPVDPRLDAARGSLRDTIGALRNLEQLLKSVRVGPRALSAVIPDVRASLDSLLGAERELIGSVSGLPDARASEALQQFTSPRVGTLEHALREAEHRPLNAKNRLALEQVVAKSAHELNVARALIELLEQAAHGPRIRVDLVEIVRGASQASERADEGAGEKVAVTLSSPDESVELVVNPGVAMSLVAIGVKLVGTRAPHVSISLLATGECGVAVNGEPGAGERLVLVTLPVIAPTLPCAEAAAHVSGARVERSADGSRFDLYWPTAPA